METQKTPWRKNLDKRYICGEDLLNGELLGKGLRKEMLVTLTKFNDAPAFNQKEQKEEMKTAIWLNEYPSGKPLYKPVLLNVGNGEFLSKEIGNGAIYIEDFDFSIPVILYAMPDKRHGHVARFKKYFPPATAKPDKALESLSKCTTIAELVKLWDELSKEEKALPSVLAKKDELKTSLS